MAVCGIEKIEYSRPSDLHGVEVMRVEQAARRWRVFHETYTVCTVLDAEGEAELVYRRKLYHCDAGEVLLMEPGELHANTKITPRGSFRALFLPPSMVERAAAELAVGSSQLHWRDLSIAHPYVFRAFARLHASLEGPATSLERESRLAACLRLLLNCCTQVADLRPEQAQYSRLQRCREFILEHYSRSLTLDELAAVSALSRYHLVRAFAKAFGLAPHGYQIHVRVQRARERLAAGMSAASVALETGFADQSHFCHHFRKLTGVTPTQYAKGRASTHCTLAQCNDRRCPLRIGLLAH